MFSVKSAANNSPVYCYVASGNQGDWWTVLESEPSMGSTTQLHTASMRGPELAHTMMEMEGPYVNVNKGQSCDEMPPSRVQMDLVISTVEPLLSNPLV